MKKRWWIGLAVVLGVALTAVTAKARPADPVTVQTVTVTAQRVEHTVTCSGVVECGGQSGVFVPVDCVITEVKVQVGQRVKQGDVLAVINREATGEKMADPSQLMVLAAMAEELTAPQDGVITAVKAAAGKTLTKGTPCAVIAPDRDVQVRIAIRERDLPSLKTGLSVRVTGDGFKKAQYKGTLTDIAATAQSGNGGTVVEGVITLDEGQVDTSLRLGLSAKACIVTKVRQEAVLLPYEAVLTEGERSYVYVVENGIAKQKEITVTAQLGEGLLVGENLLGLQIVTNPESVTADGAAVLAEENL